MFERRWIKRIWPVYVSVSKEKDYEKRSPFECDDFNPIINRIKLVAFSITIIFLIFEIVFEIIPFLSIIFYRIISIFLILFNFNFRMNKLIT